MSTTGRDVAVEVFDDRMHAELAVEQLTQAGFHADQIGVIIPDAPAGVEAPHLPSGTLAEEGAFAGATGGAVVGAVLGIALSAALLPGVGLALVGGFLIAALAGAAGGSVLGALLGLGVPEEEAHAHAEAFHSGSTLVTVRAGSRYDEAVAILQRAAAQRDPRETARIRARLTEMAEDGALPPGGWWDLYAAALKRPVSASRRASRRKPDVVVTTTSGLRLDARLVHGVVPHENAAEHSVSAFWAVWRSREGSDFSDSGLTICGDSATIPGGPAAAAGPDRFAGAPEGFDMNGRPHSHRFLLLLGTVLIASLGLLNDSGVRGQPGPQSPEPPLADDLQLPPTNANRPGAPTLTPANPQAPPVVPVEPTDPPPPEVTLKVRVAATAAKDRDLVYRLLVENRSPTSRAHHVIVRDSLPDNVKYVSATPKPSVEPAADKREEKPEVRWELGTLAPLERRELTVTLRPTGGDVRNTARIQFEFGQTVLTRLGRSDLGLKVTGPTSMAVMDKKDFIAEVTNTGPVVASDVSLKANLPPGIELSLSEPPETAEKTLTWNLGDLQPGASRRVRLELLARKEGEGALNLEATDASGGLKPASANIDVGQARLVLHMKGPANRFLNSPVTYEITVNNVGSFPASGVVIDYAMPPECQFVNATTPGVATGDHVRWSIGNLAVGERRQVGLTLKLKNTTEVVNLHSSAEATADRGIKAQAPKVITLFEGGTGLAFEVEQAGHRLELDTEGRYIVKVRNQGTAEATGVSLVVRLPVQLKFVSAAGATEGKENGGTVTFAPLERLDPGKEVRFEVAARALRVGEARVRIDLKANQTAPVTGEESTHIFGDTPPPMPTVPPVPSVPHS